MPRGRLPVPGYQPFNTNTIMAETKYNYRVDSPIKRNGKRYKPGSTIRLTEAEAEGLHVTRAADQAKAAGSDGNEEEEIDLAKGSRAHDDWRAVVEFIEATPYETLKQANFVGDDEDRSSVQKAWEAKQAEAAGT